MVDRSNASGTPGQFGNSPIGRGQSATPTGPSPLQQQQIYD